MMQRLRITAQPVAGIACDGYLTLDGMLAYHARMRRLGSDALMMGPSDLVDDEPLPLARCVHGDDWWWAASVADVQWRARDTQHWNKRYDVEQAAHYVDFGGKSERVLTSSGAYKAYHQPLYLLLAERLTWYAVGDLDGVTSLLAAVDSVGKKTAMGFGALVDGCHVEPWHADWSCWRHGVPMRPLPLAGLPEDARDYTVGEYGIRPPYWHPAQRRLCALPPLQLP